ncbi:MAG: gamma-glutamyltransferase [Rhodospirillaceae bacterium]|nr:gamma-glutamyltransferase [Rhodospirillaceae bacterium]
MRNYHFPGRSVVQAINGVAATSNPLSTLAAIDVLRQGGNAIDASVAACAVQCVVEPMSTGIGGDCFVLYQKGGTGPVIGINGSGWSPAGLTLEHLEESDVSVIGTESIESVTIPGAIDAWCAIMESYGALGIDTVLQPAIRLAEDGFAISEVTQQQWSRRVDGLRGNAAASTLYLKAGDAPATGDVWRSPALGQTLRVVAKKGRDGFYAGPVLDQMLADLQAAGGMHTADDFTDYCYETVTPIASGYRGRTVLEIPPSGQGITAQIMLNILEDFDLTGLDPCSAERFHLMVEAQRLAFVERDKFVADQRATDVPIDFLLSEDLATTLRSHIREDQAIDHLPIVDGPKHEDTVYLTVVDRDLNCVSFINSLFWGFGSCIASEKTGVVFQNRGSGFVMERGHPNCVGPRKRPLHTIIPGMVLDGDGKCELSFGVMGGHYQPVGHGQVITNLWDHGLDIQQAIDCPRVFHNGAAIEAEDSVPAETLVRLEALGHAIEPAPHPHGGSQGIVIDRVRGVLAAGSDPRKDGCALGY